MRVYILLFLALSVLLGNSVLAAPVIWTLDNVLLDDGQYLTGNFTYDVDTDTYSDLSITSPEIFWWPYLSEHTFTGSSARSDASSLGLYRNSPEDVSHSVELFFDNDLTDQGGGIALVVNGLSREEYYDHNFNGLGYRYVVSGSVSAVPVPAAVWLFGSGLGLLGWYRRRQTG